MINAPKVRQELPEVEYTDRQESGLLRGQDAGTTLEGALQARRQKLAGERIGLQPTPGDGSEQ